MFEKINVSVGITQGSFFSLIFYLFYNANLIEISTWHLDLKTSGFIDDIMLIATNSKTKSTNIILEKSHKDCFKWSEKHRLNFTPKKYQLIYFV